MNWTLLSARNLHGFGKCAHVGSSELNESELVCDRSVWSSVRWWRLECLQRRMRADSCIDDAKRVIVSRPFRDFEVQSKSEAFSQMMSIESMRYSACPKGLGNASSGSCQAVHGRGVKEVTEESDV